MDPFTKLDADLAHNSAAESVPDSLGNADSDTDSNPHSPFPRNLVLHEFAHALDFENQEADGAPRLAGKLAALWPAIMSAELDRFREKLAEGAAVELDPYAAVNPAEFFAVATETFFERPHALLHEAPSVYALLQRFYALDPAGVGSLPLTVHHEIYERALRLRSMDYRARAALYLVMLVSLPFLLYGFMRGEDVSFTIFAALFAAAGASVWLRRNEARRRRPKLELVSRR